MGSTTLLDILGSMLVGGMLFLMAMRMNDQATQTTFNCQEQLTVQQNLTFLVEAVSSDFRKIGYNANPTIPFNQGQYVRYADSNRISFLADMNRDGVFDTVTWQLGPVVNHGSGARELDRTVDTTNGGSSTIRYLNVGVTRFFLQYFDDIHPNSPLDDTTHPIIATDSLGNSVQMIELTVAVVPTAAYDTNYSSNISVWRQRRLMSMNLRGR